MVNYQVSKFLLQDIKFTENNNLYFEEKICMKKIVLLVVLIMFLFLTSCRALYHENFPAKKPMTKWESQTVELYILEKTPDLTCANYAIWVFKDTGKTFYGVFFPDCSICLYENINNIEGYLPNENSDKYVARYNMMGYTESFCHASGASKIYLDIFPEDIYFRLTETDLIKEDLPPH